ncbi:TIR domain-containing protein [Bradyrhizobium sp. AUGA SZCCT0283]|uniref:nSTAND1 domain-containing NTPase n=1 Tax=Bradyrhizobium sp. AUGA SZCCT0283 TaxID=2807671 RepID=UPI001BA46478|nr:TIR domain-containing protein [Bradyrhizobium sp. AUGA SZCCT0283]MBR1279005.1 TIR domain-containing protein [Bradyrhizobium sp. AUGA SZCCT0283]
MVTANTPPCLFLSHSGADSDAARELKRRLLDSPDARAAGLLIWLDKDDLSAGIGWQAQVENAISKKTTAFAVHIGAKGVVNWVDSEVRLALSRATGTTDYPFIPILSKECGGAAALPPFAQQYHGVHDPLNNPEEFSKLLRAVLGRSPSEKAVALENPFVGLKSMTEADADRFFGRNEEITKIVDKLKSHRLIAVVADSGAGKSSLVQAGLIPAFRGGKLSDMAGREPDDRLWHVVVMRPGRDPIEGLKRAVTEAAERLGRSADECAGLRKRVDLEDPSETAYAIRCDLPVGKTETLLVVDQFEELLTETMETVRAPFVDFLIALAGGGRFRIVLTLRADHFNLCRPLANLFEHLTRDNYDAVLRLRRITNEGIAEAVRKPLALAGHTHVVEQDAVIASIRRDISDRPGDLALVQMALYAMWQMHKADGVGLLVAYSQVGGVAGALAHEAESVRKHRLNADERELLAAVFVRLVRLGETGGATRRLADLADFDARRHALAAKLASEDCGRLLLASEASIEVAHEALITQWPWLQNALQQAAADMRVLDGLMDKTRRWVSSGSRAAEHLAAGAELAEFAALAARQPDWLSGAERDFVAASSRAHTRTTFVKYAAVAALVVFAIGAASAAFVANSALKQSGQARQALLKANDEMRVKIGELQVMQSRLLADRANQATGDGDAATAMLLALEALPDTQSNKQRPPVPEADEALFKAYHALRETVVLKEHAGPLWSARFTPDGRRLVTVSDDGTGRVWDAQTGAPLFELRGHRGPVRSAEFSPDSRYVVTTSPDTTARVWDVETGREIAILEGHSKNVLRAAFSPDGRQVATASFDNTARVWEASSGKQIHNLDQHTGPVRDAIFTPDGKNILTISDDRTARLWDATTGQSIRVFEGHTGPIRSATFAKDDSDTGILRYLLMTASSDKSVRLWALDRNEPIDTFSAHDADVWSVAISYDGRQVVTASDDGTARTWEKVGTAGWAVRGYVSPKVSRRLAGHTEPVRFATFSRDGRNVVTASDDRTARIWDARTGELKAVLRGHTGQVRTAVFSPDGTRVLTASADNTARLWNVELQADTLSVVLKGGGEGLRTVAFSHNGHLVLTGAADGSAIIWNVQTGMPGTLLRKHDARVSSVMFSPDGKRVVTGSYDGMARISDAQTGNELAILKEHNGPVRSAVFSPDGLLVATAADMARLWNAKTGEIVVRLVGHQGEIHAVAFTADGKHVVTLGADHTFRTWDTQGNEVAQSKQMGQDHEAGTHKIAIRPDGEEAVTVGGDNTPRLWDVKTGGLLAMLEGHQGSLFGVSYSPDGRRIATTSADNTARIWDADARKTVAVLEGVAPMWDAAFSADGERLVTASEDGTARIWPVFPTTQALVNQAKSTVPRCLTVDQRRRAFLEPEPPAWCIAEKKWPPYQPAK